jgi:hypothetical protein
MVHAVDENKWYMSERAGRDVGLAAAEADFVENHAWRVAGEFRRGFCTERCGDRQACPVPAMVDDLNRFWSQARTRPDQPPALAAPGAVEDAEACLASERPSEGPAEPVAKQAPQPVAVGS